MNGRAFSDEIRQDVITFECNQGRVIISISDTSTRRVFSGYITLKAAAAMTFATEMRDAAKKIVKQEEKLKASFHPQRRRRKGR